MALLLACWCTRLLAAEAPGPDFTKLKWVPPGAALVGVAQSNRIPLLPIEACGDGKALNPGDSFTGLVALREKGGKRTEWLLYVEGSAPEPKEAAEKPSKPFIVYTALGSKLEFVPSPAWVNLRTLGPYAASSGDKPLKAKDQRDRFSVDQASLSLGMERGTAALMRLKPEELRRIFNFRDKPFPEAEVRTNRAAVSQQTLNAEDERALVGSIPALLSYIQIVQHTRGLEEILFQMIERPSLWSILRHGFKVSLTFLPETVRVADPASWGMPAGTPVYYFPMNVVLNERLVLLLTLVVTTPRPPLLACGGVVGLLAEKPTDPENYLTLRVVQARQAKPSASGSTPGGVHGARLNRAVVRGSCAPCAASWDGRSRCPAHSGAGFRARDLQGSRAPVRRGWPPAS